MFLRVSALLVAALFSGAAAVAKPPTGTPLRIYVPGSYSGLMPALADGTQKAAQAFADEANAHGGILGRPVEIVAQDDGADLQAAEKNARTAVSDPNHLATVGHSFSAFAFPIGKLYNSQHKLFLTPYATSEKVSALGGTVFQLCFNDEFQARTLATVALQRLKARRIFVMRNESDIYAEGLARLFLENVEKMRAKQPAKYADVQVTQYRYLFDRLKIDEPVRLIHEYKPDLVFIPELKVRAAEIVREFTSHGLGYLDLLGADGWGSEQGTLDIFFSGVKSSQAGKYYYTYHWHPDVTTKQSNHIIAAMKKYMKTEPYGPGVLTFEILRQIKTIAEQLKTIDNEKIAAKLRGHHYEGVTGPVTLRADGSTERPLVLLRLTSGGLRLDSIVKPD